MYLLCVPSLACLLLLTACVTHDFPANWAAPRNDLPPDCTALTGDFYGNHWASDGRMALSEFLAGFHGSRDDVEHVVLSRPDPDILISTAYAPDGSVLRSTRFSQRGHTLRCSAQGAEVQAGGGWADQEVFGVSRITIRLGKDATGNLLLQHAETGVAFYGVIPLPGSETKWYRFGRYPAQPDRR